VPEKKWNGLKVMSEIEHIVILCRTQEGKQHDTSTTTQRKRTHRHNRTQKRDCTTHESRQHRTTNLESKNGGVDHDS